MKLKEHALQRLRILVVDDLEDAADSFGILLEMWGHDVRIAYDGGQALDAARAFAPDVVLLDLGLPSISGFDLAGQLRAFTRPGLRIIAVTGYEDAGSRWSAAQAGFDDYLVKPVDMAALEALLNEASDHRLNGPPTAAGGPAGSYFGGDL